MTCRHAFHKDCVDKWMQVGRNNCPACRSTVCYFVDFIFDLALRQIAFVGCQCNKRNDPSFIQPIITNTFSTARPIVATSYRSSKLKSTFCLNRPDKRAPNAPMQDRCKDILCVCVLVFSRFLCSVIPIYLSPSLSSWTLWLKVSHLIVIFGFLTCVVPTPFSVGGILQRHT